MADESASAAGMDAAAVAAAEISPDVLPGDALGALTGADLSFTFGDTTYRSSGGVATITPSAANRQPSLSLPGLDASHYYTVFATDPDAPSRADPAFREFVHAVWQNVPGDAEDLAKGGDAACPYIGPGPPCNAGKHRYVFLVYDQGEAKVDIHAAQDKFEGRGGGKVHAFAVEQGFTGPLAVAAFEAEWEEFVDSVHEAISFMPPPKFQSPGQKAQVAAAAAAAEAGADGGKTEEGDESKGEGAPKFREWMAVANKHTHGDDAGDDEEDDGFTIKTEDQAFYEPMGEWLFKRGHKWHTWHKRYGKLADNTLTYFDGMDDDATKKGSITLGANSSVKMIDHLHRNRHCFLVVGDDGTELMAHGETGRDTEKWMKFLRAHIRKAKHDAKHKK